MAMETIVMSMNVIDTAKIIAARIRYFPFDAPSAVAAVASSVAVTDASWSNPAQDIGALRRVLKSRRAQGVRPIAVSSRVWASAPAGAGTRGP